MDEIIETLQSMNIMLKLMEENMRHTNEQMTISLLKISMSLDGIQKLVDNK